MSELFRVCFGFCFKSKVKNRKMKFQFSIFDFKSKNEKRFDYCFSITKLKRKTKKFQFWFLFQIEKRIILSIHGLKNNPWPERVNPWPERVNLIFNLNWIENWKKFNFQFLILNWILKFKAIFNFHFSSRIFDI